MTQDPIDDQQRQEVRLALPSKGPLGEPALELLANAGLHVYKPNPRQYKASIPSLPGLTVLFQRPGDIVVSVREGSVDFGVTGWDVTAEKAGRGVENAGRGVENAGRGVENAGRGAEEAAISPAGNNPVGISPTGISPATSSSGLSSPVLVIHPALGFGACTLNVIVPENWDEIRCMADLKRLQETWQRPLRVATKFPNLAGAFFRQHGLEQFELINAEGTLEIAPTIGYADLITDLVSTGTTLRDNRLNRIEDGQILASQSCLIANRLSLKNNPAALGIARQLLEFIVAYLRATETVSVFVNIRGDSAESIAARMFTKRLIGGLQGPTLSPVITRSQPVMSDQEKWFAAHLIIRKDQLVQAIAELREVGGSGVVVAPVTYIFEEEPAECRAMLAQLEE